MTTSTDNSTLALSQLAQWAAPYSVAELHGMLVASLCVLHDKGIQHWQNELLILEEPPEDLSALSVWAQDIHQQLANDYQFGFVLYGLPEDDLKQRLQAVIQWCEGFLYILGTLALKPDEELQEFIEDVSQFTQVDCENELFDEDSATAIEEMIEYLQAGVMLCYLTKITMNSAMPQDQIIH